MIKTSSMANKGFFLKLAGISLLIDLCMRWTLTFQPLVSGWAYSVVYFVYTWICFQVLLDKGVNKRYLVVSAIIIGRIITEMVEKISDLSGSILSLMVPIITIISVILATICFYERRIPMYILSTVILLLMNTFVHEAYLEHFRSLIGR